MDRKDGDGAWRLRQDADPRQQPQAGMEPVEDGKGGFGEVVQRSVEVVRFSFSIDEELRRAGYDIEDIEEQMRECARDFLARLDGWIYSGDARQTIAQAMETQPADVDDAEDRPPLTLAMLMDAANSVSCHNLWWTKEQLPADAMYTGEDLNGVQVWVSEAVPEGVAYIVETPKQVVDFLGQVRHGWVDTLRGINVVGGLATLRHLRDLLLEWSYQANDLYVEVSGGDSETEKW